MTSVLSRMKSLRPPLFGLRRRKIGADEQGSVLIEAAVTLPILIAVIISLVDVGLYILAHQKSQRAATTVGDLVARLNTVSTASVTNLIDAADHVMSPFNFSANGGIIVTSVSKAPGQAARVDWQIAEVGASGMSSQIGAPGGTATLGNGMILVDGENVIVTEVEYDFEFLFAEFLDPGTNIYHDSVFRPRGDPLSTLQ